MVASSFVKGTGTKHHLIAS